MDTAMLSAEEKFKLVGSIIDDEWYFCYRYFTLKNCMWGGGSMFCVNMVVSVEGVLGCWVLPFFKKK